MNCPSCSLSTSCISFRSSACSLESAARLYTACVVTSVVVWMAAKLIASCSLANLRVVVVSSPHLSCLLPWPWSAESMSHCSMSLSFSSLPFLCFSRRASTTGRKKAVQSCSIWLSLRTSGSRHAAKGRSQDDIFSMARCASMTLTV